MSERRIFFSVSSDRSEASPSIKPVITVSSQHILQHDAKADTEHKPFHTYIQSRWAKFAEPHVCSLIERVKEVDILKEVIDIGVWIRFRRWMKAKLMINRKHPFTKRVFKSQSDYFMREADEEMAQQVIFETALMMLGIGIRHDPLDVVEAIGDSCIMGSSFLLQFWIMGKLFVLWRRFLFLTELGEEQFQQLDGFMQHKGLPPNIRNEIYRYYQYKFQNRYHNESVIVKELPHNLRAEIPNYKIGLAFEKIRFLRLLPNSLIKFLVAKIEHVYFCPGDTIFRVNTKSNCLYFIKKGTVALHDEHDVEVCHLEDGGYYGDIAVVLNLEHSVTMTAISPCKIMVLRHKVLWKILDRLPDIKEKLSELSRNLLINRKRDWVLNPNNPRRTVTLQEESRSYQTSLERSNSLRSLHSMTPYRDESLTFV